MTGILRRRGNLNTNISEGSENTGQRWPSTAKERGLP